MASDSEVKHVKHKVGAVRLWTARNLFGLMILALVVLWGRLWEYAWFGPMHLYYTEFLGKRGPSCPRFCWELAAKKDVGVGGACQSADCTHCAFCESSWIGRNRSCPAPTVFETLDRSACRHPQVISSRAADEIASLRSTFFNTSVDWCARLSDAKINPRAQLKGTIVNSICYQTWLAREQNGGVGVGGNRSANVLIFSLGFDSPFWLAINAGGATHFIENSAEWISMQPQAVQDKSILVQYGARWPEADWLLCDHMRLSRFVSNLPEHVQKTCWDVILVDAPLQGFWHPGRMESIYAARALSSPTTVVYVDDCERRVEILYTMTHLVHQGKRLSVIDNGHSGFTCLVEPDVVA